MQKKQIEGAMKALLGGLDLINRLARRLHTLSSFSSSRDTWMDRCTIGRVLTKNVRTLHYTRADMWSDILMAMTSIDMS